jgi:hypothetical protein
METDVIGILVFIAISGLLTIPLLIAGYQEDPERWHEMEENEARLARARRTQAGRPCRQ